jgi:hypothetical protein
MFQVDGIGKFKFSHLISGYSGFRYTTCTLYDHPEFTNIVGYAHCHPSDQFNKAVGRKLALTRILEHPTLKLNKAQRTKVWNAYFEWLKPKQKKNPHWKAYFEDLADSVSDTSK